MEGKKEADTKLTLQVRKVISGGRGGSVFHENYTQSNLNIHI